MKKKFYFPFFLKGNLLDYIGSSRFEKVVFHQLFTTKLYQSFAFCHEKAFNLQKHSLERPKAYIVVAYIACHKKEKKKSDTLTIPGPQDEPSKGGPFLERQVRTGTLSGCRHQRFLHASILYCCEPKNQNNVELSF